MSRATLDFIRTYEEELEFLRESGRLFAQDHPGMAAALGLEHDDDPSIDRLLEGVAFLSTRVRLKLAASEKRIATELLGALSPVLNQPLPSMAMIGLSVRQHTDQMSGPIQVPRGTKVGLGSTTSPVRATFLTAQELNLYPWRLEAWRYVAGASLAALRGQLPKGLRTASAALRLGFEIGRQARTGGFAVPSVNLHVGGSSPALASRVLHALMMHATGVAVVADGKVLGTCIGRDALEPIGFESDESVLECGHPQYVGHRLLAEWFAMPERFQYVRIRLGQGEPVLIKDVPRVEILVLLDGEPGGLAEDLGRAVCSLNVVPVVNQYSARINRTAWNPGQTDCHLVVDRLVPYAHEILRLEEVTLYRKGLKPEPARFALDASDAEDGSNFVYHGFRQFRAPWRMRSATSGPAQADKPASSFHLSLMAPGSQQALLSVEQVGVTALICDGDRPQQLWRSGNVRWTVESSGDPEVEVLVAPTACVRRHLTDVDVWGLVASLRQSLETLTGPGRDSLATRWRELLARFELAESARGRRMIESLRSLAAESTTRRAPGEGPLAFCRGVALTIETGIDDLDATPVFLFSMVLDRFLGGHCSINGFTQLRVRTPLSEVAWEWPVRRGTTELL